MVTPAPTLPLGGKRALVVERCKTLTKAMSDGLRQLGLTVEVVNSASEGLLRAAHWHPDLMVSSVEVGELSGYDLCALLRMIPELAGLPVILISSSEADLLKRKAADAGADYYVHKDQRFAANLVRAVEQAFHLVASSTSIEAQRARKIRRVLLVDDSRVMRRIIRNILNSTGMTDIAEAEHGAAALHRLAPAAFDLAITDWNMPVMDGLALVKAIRQNPLHASLLVAMVTTEGSHEAMASAKAAGADGHLSKPFSVESLRRLIHRLESGNGWA